MERSIIKVDGMMCDHCVKAVTEAVSTLPGVRSVSVNLKSGTVTVEHDPAQNSLDKIKSKIDEQGYDIIE